MRKKHDQVVTRFLCAIDTRNQHGQHLFSGWAQICSLGTGFSGFKLQRTKTTHPQTFEKHDAQELEATGRPAAQEPVSQEPMGQDPKAQ